MATRNCMTLNTPLNSTGVYSLATSGEKLGISSTNTYTLDRFLSASSYNLYLTWVEGISINYELTKDATVTSFIPGDPRLRYLSKSQGDTSTGIIVFLPNPDKTDKFMILSPPYSTTQVLSTNPTANYFTKTVFTIPSKLLNTCFYNTQTGGYVIFGYGSLYNTTDTYYGIPATNIVTYSQDPNSPNEYFNVTEITDTTIKAKYVWMKVPGRKYVDEINIDISRLPNSIIVQGVNGFTFKSQFLTTGFPVALNLINPPPFTLISPPPPISITPGIYSTSDAINREIFTFKTGFNFDFTNVTLPQATITNRTYSITGEQIDFGLFWPGLGLKGKYLSPTSFTWNGTTFVPIITDLFGDWLFSASNRGYSTPFTVVSQSFSSWVARYPNSDVDNFYINADPSNTSRFIITDGSGFWSTDAGMPTIGTLNDKKNTITGNMARVPSATFTLTRYYGQLNPNGKTFTSSGNSTLTMTFTDNSNGQYSYYDDINGMSGAGGFTYTLTGNQLVTGAPIPMVETNVFKISETDLVSTGYVTIVMIKV